MFIHTSDVALPGKVPLLFNDHGIANVGMDEFRNLDIDWNKYRESGVVKPPAKKSPREHQTIAVENVVSGLRTADRGHVVMACGTGKTFTGLKIAEEMVGAGKVVLVLVPSLPLMSQTVREWEVDSDVTLHSISICCDPNVGKIEAKRNEASQETSLVLAFPSTTDSKKVAFGVHQALKNPVLRKRMIVVFSTYHSIKVITQAQKHKEYPVPAFDLVICDEAHRTTGVTLAKDNESSFVKVHKNEFVAAKKRLYMTATPRVYDGEVKKTADERGATLASMDDKRVYGERFYELGFADAVDKDLLTDYKVVVLSLDEGIVSAHAQKEMDLDEAGLDISICTRIIGCFKALTKRDIGDLDGDSPHPMRRSIAFCSTVADSSAVADNFREVIDVFCESKHGKNYRDNPLSCEVKHVDGTKMDPKERARRLKWLKEDVKQGDCKILTNVKCLGEGVDVPALDSVMFLHPKGSQIDVVQAVGRVMRKSPGTGKKCGYVILPVCVPAGTTAQQILSHSTRYKVVWKVLNALRSHDADLDAVINRASFQKESKIVFVWPKGGFGSEGLEDVDPFIKPPVAQEEFSFEKPDKLTRAVMAKIIQPRVGARLYWKDWAHTVGETARRQTQVLAKVLTESDTEARAAFDKFHAELRDDLNEGITEKDAIEMLAQHSATRPVFEALFGGQAPPRILFQRQ